MSGVTEANKKPTPLLQQLQNLNLPTRHLQT